MPDNPVVFIASFTRGSHTIIKVCKDESTAIQLRKQAALSLWDIDFPDEPLPEYAIGETYFRKVFAAGRRDTFFTILAAPLI